MCGVCGVCGTVASGHQFLATNGGCTCACHVQPRKDTGVAGTRNDGGMDCTGRMLELDGVGSPGGYHEPLRSLSLGCCGSILYFCFFNSPLYPPCLRHLHMQLTSILYCLYQEKSCYTFANMMLHTQTIPTDPNEEKQRSGIKTVLKRWKESFKSNNSLQAPKPPKLPSSPAHGSCTSSIASCSDPSIPSQPSRPSSQPSRPSQVVPITASQAHRRPASSVARHSHRPSKPSSIRSSLSRTSRQPVQQTQRPPDPILNFTTPTTQTIIHSPFDKRNNRSSISAPALALRRPHLGSRRDPLLQESTGNRRMSRMSTGIGHGIGHGIGNDHGNGNGNSSRNGARRSLKPQSHLQSQSQSTRPHAASVPPMHASLNQSKVRFSLKVDSVKMMREEGGFQRDGGWRR